MSDKVDFFNVGDEDTSDGAMVDNSIVVDNVKVEMPVNDYRDNELKEDNSYDSQVDRLIDISSRCKEEVLILRSSLFADNSGHEVERGRGGLFGKGKESKPDKSPQILSEAMSIVIETLEDASSMLESLSNDVKVTLGNRRL